VPRHRAREVDLRVLESQADCRVAVGLALGGALTGAVDQRTDAVRQGAGRVGRQSLATVVERLVQFTADQVRLRAVREPFGVLQRQ